MSSDLTSRIIAAIKVPVDDPHFAQRAFSVVAKQRKAKAMDDVTRACSEEYDDLSRRLDRSKIQESCAVRNVLRTRLLATMLINDKGEILTELLPAVIQKMQAYLYSLGPNRQYDTRRQEQIIKALTTLKENKDALRLLKNISKPHAHRHAEQLIRETLQLPPNSAISDATARRAVLSAWMCFLRQNVGSCFATAPAIIVHDEMPLQFLKDMNELLGTGRLKRTFGGIEYSVPLSISWGAGDLKRNFIIQGGAGLENSELWLSPGLIAAYEAVGIFPADLPLKQKVEATKSRTRKLFESLPPQAVAVVNAEEIIRRTLLMHLKLTEQDLKEYENRPHGMLQSNLMMQVPASATSSGGKGQACAQFYVLLESAENAFKQLADNALLKSWEFTIASFAETKAEFTKWNLYSSLGMGPEEKGGIGFSIYQVIKYKLDRSNQKVQDTQMEYEQKYSSLKYLEARMQRATTEKEIQWMKIEYSTKLHEFQMLEEMRDREHRKGQRLSNIFNVLIDAYYELFPRYFQEVYDADMHQVVVGPYDDSPAGFRLLYKYGRTNTSQWTYIENPQDFVGALNSFFIATENELVSRQEFKGLEQELSEIITAVVTQIKTVEFLETAFYRMAVVHKSKIIKDPLEHLDQIDKKPWAYTSGGTMGSLVSCYFGLEQLPAETARWVENPMELLVFFVDTLKQIPPKYMDHFFKENRQSLLMHSPTHAFLLKPLYKSFFEAWQNEAFTYTAVRDQIIKPMERALDMIQLDESMTEYLVQQLAAIVPEDFRHYFKKVFARLHGTISPMDFRNHIVDTMEGERGLMVRGNPVLPAEEIDAFLQAALPLVPMHQLGDRLRELYALMPMIKEQLRQDLAEVWELIPGAGRNEPYITAKAFLDIAQALIALATHETSSDVNWTQQLMQAARECGYALPSPIPVADSNWMKDDFAFVVNPGTGKVDFWRMDTTGQIGAPMAQWTTWLNGSRKDISWGIYTRPYEYFR